MRNINKLFLFTVFFTGIVVSIYYSFKPTLKAVNVNSNVVNGDRTQWKVEKSSSSNNYKPGIFYFIDENIGFSSENINGKAILYKTTSGGNLWQIQYELDDFFVNDLYFTSSSKGFVVGSKLKPSSIVSENGSEVLKTEDGGQTWKSVYFAPSIIFEKVAFNPEGNGAAVGRKASPTIWDSSNFIIVSQDFGNTWKDVSGQLVDSYKNEKNQKTDYLTNILFARGNLITVVSMRGKVLASNDFGTSWELIAEASSDSQLSGINQLGVLENGNIWLAGGSASNDNKSSVFMVMTENGWNSYNLNNYFFSDVKVLSNDELFACGTHFILNGEGKNISSDRTGTVLYSSDNGLTWTIIHEAEATKRFISINQLSKDKLIVFDENGGSVVITR